MRLALETGAVIYPSFVFGASDMLDQLAAVGKDKAKSTAGERRASSGTRMLGALGTVMESISRKIGGGLTLYYGQYYLPVPYNPQMSMVLGNPIYPDTATTGKHETMTNISGNKTTCKRVENPTQQQVEELMERYVEALQNLFEQYKEEAGYPHDTLRII